MKPSLKLSGFAVLLGVAAMVRPNKPSVEKLTSYESGVDPVGDGWSQSQVRYYIFALLFVIFDVEAVFIFPWATRLEVYAGKYLGLLAALAAAIALTAALGAGVIVSAGHTAADYATVRAARAAGGLSIVTDLKLGIRGLLAAPAPVPAV